MRRDLIRITPLPQSVPSSACLTCDVCCRFPEADSFLRPYFTADEIAQAISNGIDSSAFPDLKGSQIRVVPNPTGEGYLCPAFDPATSRCRIYDVRPLDCQIYPLAMMWSADGTEVVLGWDTKCPFMRTGSAFGGRGSGLEQIGSKLEARSAGLEAGTEPIDEYAAKIAGLIEREDMVETLAHNPRLIGRYQDDVVAVRSLPRLTERLHKDKRSNLERRTSIPIPTLRPLTPEDWPRFQQAVAAIDTPLAAYAVAPHVSWRHLFTYSWTEYDGHLCLFADYPDGRFMPLPPLGPGPLKEPLARAWACMRERNHDSAVSRVENVPQDWRPQWEAWGYRLRPKDSDYLYAVRALAELRGDRYKSQRAACNRFVRVHRFRYEPYDERDRDRCLDLYRRWTRQKEARGMDPVATMMLEDAFEAHRTALTESAALGLIGRVVWVDDVLVAYTFGYFRAASVFCVMLEVADRSLPGLAAYLFREFSREAFEAGAIFINTMDDSGLPLLRRSKRAYHPARMVESYIATDSGILTAE